MPTPNEHISFMLNTIDSVDREAERRQVIHGLDTVLPDDLFLGEHLVLPYQRRFTKVTDPVTIPNYAKDPVSDVALEVQFKPAREYTHEGWTGSALTTLAIQGTLRKKWARGDVQSEPIDMYEVVYKKKIRSYLGKIPRSSDRYELLEAESNPTLVFDHQVGFYRYTPTEASGNNDEEIVSLSPGSSSFEELGYLLKAFTKRQKQILKKKA